MWLTELRRPGGLSAQGRVPQLRLAVRVPSRRSLSPSPIRRVAARLGAPPESPLARPGSCRVSAQPRVRAISTQRSGSPRGSRSRVRSDSIPPSTRGSESESELPLFHSQPSMAPAAPSRSCRYSTPTEHRSSLLSLKSPLLSSLRAPQLRVGDSDSGSNILSTEHRSTYYHHFISSPTSHSTNPRDWPGLMTRTSWSPSR